MLHSWYIIYETQQDWCLVVYHIAHYRGFFVTSVIVVICDYAVCCNADGFYCGNVYKEEEL